LGDGSGWLAVPMFGLLGLPHQFYPIDLRKPAAIPPARARRGHAPDPARIAERSWASTIPKNGWFEPEKLGFYGRFNGGSLSQDLGFNTFQYSNKSDFG